MKNHPCTCSLNLSFLQLNDHDHRVIEYECDDIKKNLVKCQIKINKQIKMLCFVCAKVSVQFGHILRS